MGGKNNKGRRNVSIREYLEQQEYELLSEFASKSASTKGRDKPISSDNTRTEYQRDRDRILHCKSFRRLQFKTQVFLSPEGDHYRTRLTHTLEVSQIARSISRALRLNEDLTEAIALGHDLGHTPFGHIGERTLSRLLNKNFSHNEQSLRVVEVLEYYGDGLNLTWETRDGILNHSSGGRAATMEGRCVALADRIAYINHDIDDSIRAGILTEDDLPKNCIAVLGNSHGDRIDTMIKDTVQNSFGKPEILMSPRVQKATDSLRDFLFSRVYQDDWRTEEEKKCDFVIENLFKYFINHPYEMPEEYKKIFQNEGAQRAITDYISSMTDRFAMRTFRRIFEPDPFNVI
jgi:dGTPase